MIRSIHIDKYVAIIKIDEILEELKDLNLKKLNTPFSVILPGIS